MKDDSFLAEIRRDPRDFDLRHVYADWLDERGDVRGEYVRLQVERSGMSLEHDPEGRLPTVCERMMQLRGEIDERWLAEMEQPSVMIGNPTPYGADWMATELPVLREFDATSRCMSYENVPDLPLDVCVLDDLSAIEAPDYVVEGSEMRELGPELAEALGADGITLPEPLLRAVRDESYHARLVVGMCCDVDLVEVITPCPLLPDVRIVPFWIDSQYCYFAMLYLHPSGGHCVITSGDRRFIGGEFDEYEDDDDEGYGERRVEPLAEHISFSASSFTTFVHRWRLEHSLWDYSEWLRSERGEYVTRSLLDARPPERPALTPDVQAYADALLVRAGIEPPPPPSP